MRRALLLGALLALLAGLARAQTVTTDFTKSFTLTTSSATYVPYGPMFQYLAIDNPSATINVACAFSTTAALNAGGSFMIPAGTVRIWPAYAGAPMPSGAINCIASSGSPTITIVWVR